MWSPPGGHLLKHESIIDCARREVVEETGLKVARLRIGPFVNECNSVDGTHYLNVFVIAEYASGALRNGEPEDVSEWRWFDPAHLPRPLFFNLRALLGKFDLPDLRRIRSNRGIDCKIRPKR